MLFRSKCKTEEISEELEKDFHNELWYLRIRESEWFRYDKKVFEKIFEKYREGKDFITKERRQPIITNTVFGEQEHFGIKNAPPCRFYPSLRAQILGNYEYCMKLTIPYRTMEFPTYGEQMLWPHSTDLDRVFISDRKHKENMELNRHLKEKEKQIKVIEPPSNLTDFLLSSGV